MQAVVKSLVVTHLSEHNAHIHEIVVLRPLNSGAVFVSDGRKLHPAILQVRMAGAGAESRGCLV
jgi:hypothetical protein